MLSQKLQADQLTALKSGDKEKLETLRFTISRIKNQEIEKREELTDDETVAVLKKIVRELHESLDAAEKGQRNDLIDKSKKQIDILAPYLPEEISDEELKKTVEEIIERNKHLFRTDLPAGRQDKKAIIGICMKELRSKADPARIMTVLQPYLQ